MDFDLSGITTATTRTLTMPDNDVDLGSAFAEASHNHAAGDINSGTLAHERGGIEADISAIATGGILYGSGAGAMAILAAGSNDDVLTQAAGVPSWAAPAAAAGYSISGRSYNSSGVGLIGEFFTRNMVAAAYTGHHTLFIPSSVTTINSVILYFFSDNATGNGQMDVDVDYCAVDEQYNNHSGQLLNQTITLTTDNDLYGFDIIAALGSLTGGDALGVKITNDHTNNFDMLVTDLVVDCD